MWKQYLIAEYPLPTMITNADRESVCIDFWLRSASDQLEMIANNRCLNVKLPK